MNTPERRILVDDQSATRGELDALAAMLDADTREQVQWRERLPAIMSDAVESGIRKALADPTVLDSIHGHLSRRTRQRLAEWVFDRLTTVVASLVIAASLTWWALFRGGKD